MTVTRSEVRRQVSEQGGRVAGLVVLAVTLPLTVALLVEFVAPTRGWPTAAWILALCVALHALGLFGRRHPRVSFVAGAAIMLALAYTHAPGVSSAALVPSAAAFLLLLWQFAATQPLSTSAWGLAVGVVGAGVITAIDTMANGTRDPAVIVFEMIALSAVVGAAWVWGREHRRRRRASAAEAERVLRDAVAEERMRIGRDLHDVVSHTLTVMITQAEAAKVLSDSATSAAAMERVAQSGRSAMDGLRGMLRVLDDGGAPADLQPVPLLHSLPTLVQTARTPEHDVRFRSTGTAVRLPADAELALLRATQEALTNAVRHVRAPLTVDVVLEWTAEAAVLTVTDDGGRGVHEGLTTPGTGLRRMAERVEHAGGRLEVLPGDGWRVRVTMPVEAAP